MKKLFSLLVLISFVSSSFAQSEKYVAAMKQNLAAFDTAFKKPEYLQSLGNSFERIANAEKNQWQPYYYAALSQLNYAFLLNQPEQNDAIADQAKKNIDAADKLSPENSEISVLKAMEASVRMIVNPMERYMTMGMLSDNEIQNAMKQDDTNPRPYYFKGTMIRHTPEQFGGGCKPAMEFFTKAMERFDSFKPAGDLNPSWGKKQTEMYMDGCK